MSVIWDQLRETKTPLGNRHYIEELPSGESCERRQSPRTSTYVPVFVYGYTSADEPFHQDTNTLQVNANGGLLRLDAKVHYGQKILVMNRVTREEQECYVVTLIERPKRADVCVGVAFARSAPGFWSTRR